ncbi:MAG: IS3-like element IS1141 family transposase, partial [Candidatus Dormibacteria bacterium]
MIETTVSELIPVVGTRGACTSVGRSRATHYRRLTAPPPRPGPKGEPAAQPRALRPTERAQVLEVLHSERFVDMAPPSVYATLLDEGVYLASVPTMYRILRSVDEVRERRRVAVRPPYVKPELVAWRPNMIW